nr:MAG TPA: hypothetical protein [Caudoviricetes sp.]
MSVRKKDRHQSKNDYLNDARKLVHQVLILVRPYQELDDGSHIKPGILGNPYYYSAFGADILKCAKNAHGYAFSASLINLKNKKTLVERADYFNKSIRYCDSILRQLDLCIYEYGLNNKKKNKSFKYVAKLTYKLKQNLLDRINRDNLIYSQRYK